MRGKRGEDVEGKQGPYRAGKAATRAIKVRGGREGTAKGKVEPVQKDHVDRHRHRRGKQAPIKEKKVPHSALVPHTRAPFDFALFTYYYSISTHKLHGNSVFCGEILDFFILTCYNENEIEPGGCDYEQ